MVCTIDGGWGVTTALSQPVLQRPHGVLLPHEAFATGGAGVLSITMTDGELSRS
jgi:hypothetical protein